MNDIARNYLKEYSKLEIYRAFYSKNKKVYRRQKEKLFKNALISLSETKNAPYSLKNVRNNNIYELVKLLSKKNANGTIANKISVIKRGLKYIGIDITVSVKAFRVKKIHSSKYYRVRDKVYDIENQMFRNIAYFQSISGLSYDDLNKIFHLEINEKNGRLFISTSIWMRVLTIHFRSKEAMQMFLNIRESMIEKVSQKYNAINIQNITSLKPKSYRAFKTLYLEELRIKGMTEFDLRSVGYMNQWDAIFKERFFVSQKKEDFRDKLKKFKSWMGIEDTRTVKKYLGIV